MPNSPAIDRSTLRRRLLAWFDRHARSLPWRQSRDSYRIWISEIMLQQTTVAAVIPYFHRFLARFPSVAELAAAEESDVLRLWEGLGYYSRARNLHRAAKLVVDRHAGALPNDAALVHDLPGFGRYTTNAVLSQAFDVRLPILEANSVRLLCRLFAIDDDTKAPATLAQLWRLAEEILPTRRIGDFNQALMELGALICTPTSPQCDECPLTGICRAKAAGRVDEIPRKAARPKVEEVREVALVLWRGDRVLLVQRPATGRGASMWEFPRAVVDEKESGATAAADLAARLGFDATIEKELTTLRHGVTRFRITLVAMTGRCRKGTFRADDYPRGEWLEPNQLADYPVSRPQRRLTELLIR